MSVCVCFFVMLRTSVENLRIVRTNERKSSRSLLDSIFSVLHVEDNSKRDSRMKTGIKRLFFAEIYPVLYLVSEIYIYIVHVSLVTRLTENNSKCLV